MMDDTIRRDRDDRHLLRGVVAEIATSLAAQGWGQPARLSIVHGPDDHLVESTLASDGTTDDLATLLAGFQDLVVHPDGRAAIDLLVAELVPQPVRAWLLVFETETSSTDPVPERVTLAVDRSGRGYAALSTGQGAVPAVCQVEFAADEPIGTWAPAYRCLTALAAR